MKTLALTIFFALLITSCSLTPEKPTSNTNAETKIIAHGAGAGLWGQNSRNAVVQSLAAIRRGDLKNRFHGIEVDIVLTKDNVPVLSHDPWVHKTSCRRVDNIEIGHRLIKDIYYDDLIRNYRCGGIEDPKHPDVITVSETILGFDEFLTLVKAVPKMIIYLDMKIEADLTASNHAYAKAVFDRWQSAAMPNVLYVEGPTKGALAAYQQYSQLPFKSILSFPPFYSNQKMWTLQGAAAAVKTLLKSASPLEQAQAAQADAIASPVIVMQQKAMKKLQDNDIEIIVFTPNDRESITDVCQSGVDMLITDYPNLGPCP